MRTVGIDTGGTFTDFVVDDRVLKVRSTPDDPARAVLQGLRTLGLDGVLRIVHGTTVATNALLTRTLARTAFVTTEGFEDLLALGRQDRPRLYDLEPRPPPPLIAPADCFGVHERLLADGAVETALDASDLPRRLRDSGVRSVAVCLLHAYKNPNHERRLGEILAKSGLPVSLSHRVANEYREFERAATTAANAALVPVMAPYLEQLRTELVPHEVEVLLSSGGAASLDEACELPVRTVLSGPAGGVLAAAELARRWSVPRAVSFDMGGTSTDVAMLDGALPVVPEFRHAGLPLRVPVLDVHTVGAGGGSIAWTDALGALRVGPRSAGADPGPACYGTGEDATVTDAHAVLGHLAPEDRLAGTLAVDVDRAHAAVGDRAADILRVANAVMERAIRAVTVQRGVDPRGCALVAFGGAGGLHACALADALALDAVLVPADPGTFSAHGMRSADRRRDFVRTVLLPADACVERLDQLLQPLRRHGLPEEAVTADVRYRGQSHELAVPGDARLAERFHAAHEREYGYCDRGREVEVVNLRVTAHERRRPREPYPPWPDVRAKDGPARMARAELEGAVRGPVVLTEATATTVVPAGWRAQRLQDGTLLLRRDA